MNHLLIALSFFSFLVSPGNTNLKNEKKVTIFVNLPSPNCHAVNQISDLSKDDEISSFYDFHFFYQMDPSSKENYNSSVFYQNVLLGTIYGIPSKEFLVELRPLFKEMLEDPKIFPKSLSVKTRGKRNR